MSSERLNHNEGNKLRLEAVCHRRLLLTENICFMCWLRCELTGRHEMKCSSLCLFSLFLVVLSCRLLLPTVLQMVQVHSSLCKCSILYRLHPLSIWSLFFFSSSSPVYLSDVDSQLLVCWSVCSTIHKQIYHRSSEDQRWATLNPLLLVFLGFVYLGVQWPLKPDGSVVSEP